MSYDDRSYRKYDYMGLWVDGVPTASQFKAFDAVRLWKLIKWEVFALTLKQSLACAKDPWKVTAHQSIDLSGFLRVLDSLYLCAEYPPEKNRHLTPHSS